jgi:hypothetical protein
MLHFGEVPDELARVDFDGVSHVSDNRIYFENCQAAGAAARIVSRWTTFVDGIGSTK